ncbi:MAG: DUF4340 domain-containing protein [Cellulosilyticaceae bacterium]
MKRKGWLTPILVFIICISFLLSYQAKQGGYSLARTIETPLSPWNIGISHITKIEFNESSKSITALFSEGNWQIVTPKSIEADSTYIYGILSNFSAPQLIDVIETNVTNLAPYGIDKFSKSITLYDVDGNKYELICGKDESPSTYYVYVPHMESIYTMHKNAFDRLSHNLSLWRDKNYLHFDAAKTSKIKITLPNKTLVITQAIKDDEVTFTSDSLSSAEIDQLFNFLRSTRVTNFIIDDASDSVIQNYGLHQPSATVSIWDLNQTVTSFSMAPHLDQPGQSYVLMKDNKNIFSVNAFKFKH